MATIRLSITTAVAFLLLTTNFAQSKAPAGKDPRAILQRNCLTCHGPARMSGLDLRQRHSMLKGGKRGPAVVPGKAEESLLYQAVLGTGELKMPQGSEPLTAAEVEILRTWIEEGARWEGEAGSSPEPSWWAFRKPQRSEVPTVKNSARVKNPIDAFILSKLEEKGLKPVATASKRTLIRRAYFDLHGLPPSPGEVEEFMNDSSPDAYT